jgi:hypothetical protein
MLLGARMMRRFQEESISGRDVHVSGPAHADRGRNNWLTRFLCRFPLLPRIFLKIGMYKNATGAKHFERFMKQFQ